MKNITLIFFNVLDNSVKKKSQDKIITFSTLVLLKENKSIISLEPTALKQTRHETPVTLARSK